MPILINTLTGDMYSYIATFRNFKVNCIIGSIYIGRNASDDM